MTKNDMEIGARYIVTKDSVDREFRVGDHIWLTDDGSVFCIEAGGWMAPEDVDLATIGMEIKVDDEWVQRELARLESHRSTLLARRSLA